MGLTSMRNYFKNNSLASGMFGFILGSATYAIGDGAFTGNVDNEETFVSRFMDADNKGCHEDKNFCGLVDDETGDVFVSVSGRCYHNRRSCYTLNNSSRVIKVKREDAIEKNLSECSKCRRW